MTSYPMTKCSYQNIKEELTRLKTKTRPQVIRDIETARAHGDLSENAEYDAAKEKQAFVEARIRDLDAKIAHAQVIDISGLKGDKVVFGATVTIYDHLNDSEQTWQIVGEDEADVRASKLSITAPMARALIGKLVGDEIEVKIPRGKKNCEIIGISFA